MSQPIAVNGRKAPDLNYGVSERYRFAHGKNSWCMGYCRHNEKWMVWMEKDQNQCAVSQFSEYEDASNWYFDRVKLQSALDSQRIKLVPVLGMNGIFRVNVDGSISRHRLTKIVGGWYSYRDSSIEKSGEVYTVGGIEFPNLVKAVEHIEFNQGE